MPCDVSQISTVVQMRIVLEARVGSLHKFYIDYIVHND